MGKTTKIECDGCDTDLTLSDNWGGSYRIRVENEHIPEDGGKIALTDCKIGPHFDGILYFCNIHCLHKYFSKITSENQEPRRGPCIGSPDGRCQILRSHEAVGDPRESVSLTAVEDQETPDGLGVPQESRVPGCTTAAHDVEGRGTREVEVQCPRTMGCVRNYGHEGRCHVPVDEGRYFLPEGKGL